MDKAEALAVLGRLKDALPTVGINGWLEGVKALDVASAALREQPGQEGGGEVCPRCKGAGEYEGFARHASGDPQDEYAATVQCEPCEGTGEVAAPPSAPVGLDPPVERQRDLLAQAIRDAAVKAGIARADADMTGPMLLMLCDDMADCILTQHPAQAAPGDGRHEYVQSKEHSGCAVCGYAEHVGLVHRTPPGDDAAGGG